MQTQRELYRPLVLCVDDDESVLEVMRISLERQGYRVLTFSSGQEALKAFAVLQVDAVILDFEMPGMDGGQVAREMGRMKPSVPKLLFSGKECFSLEEARAFQGYCPKPTGILTLAAHLSNMTSLRSSAQSA